MLFKCCSHVANAIVQSKHISMKHPFAIIVFCPSDITYSVYGTDTWENHLQNDWWLITRQLHGLHINAVMFLCLLVWPFCYYTDIFDSNIFLISSVGIVSVKVKTFECDRNGPGQKENIIRHMDELPRVTLYRRPGMEWGFGTVRIDKRKIGSGHLKKTVTIEMINQFFWINITKTGI